MKPTALAVVSGAVFLPQQRQCHALAALLGGRAKQPSLQLGLPVSSTASHRSRPQRRPAPRTRPPCARRPTGSGLLSRAQRAVQAPVMMPKRTLPLARNTQNVCFGPKAVVYYATYGSTRKNLPNTALCSCLEKIFHLDRLTDDSQILRVHFSQNRAPGQIRVLCSIAVKSQVNVSK